MNPGARDGIAFLHSLPEPLLVVIYLLFGAAFLCALAIIFTRPFR